MRTSDGLEQDGVRGAGEIDIRELLIALWRLKHVVAMITIACGALALGSSYLFARKYQTEVAFMTLADDAVGGRAGGLAALASQLGGLASLGGLSLSGNERKAEYLAILQSQTLVDRFITQNNLLPILYPDAWDENRKTWKNPDRKKQPTLWKATRYFKSNVMRINTNTKTGISTLSIIWSDPHVGARWANDLVGMANDYVKARAIEDAERNLAYLNEQLTRTSVVAVQNSISALIEEQLKKVMLAQGTDQYAFRVIDPALPPERTSFPNRIVWAILGLFIGFSSSVAFASLRRPQPPTDREARS